MARLGPALLAAGLALACAGPLAAQDGARYEFRLGVVPEDAASAVADILAERLHRTGLAGSVRLSDLRDGVTVMVDGPPDQRDFVETLLRDASIGVHLVRDTGGRACAGPQPVGFECRAMHDPARPAISVPVEASIGADAFSRFSLVYDQAGQPAVSFEMTGAGARALCKLTGGNVGEAAAVIVDGTALTAPVIHDAICGGRGLISGNFTEDEVKDLIAALNVLPAEVVLISVRVVDRADAAFNWRDFFKHIVNPE